MSSKRKRQQSTPWRETVSQMQSFRSALDRTVSCKWCKEPTTYLGTKECDPCHQTYMKMNMMFPRKKWILFKMLFIIIKESINWEKLKLWKIF